MQDPAGSLSLWWIEWWDLAYLCLSLAVGTMGIRQQGDGKRCFVYLCFGIWMSIQMNEFVSSLISSSLSTFVLRNIFRYFKRFFKGNPAWTTSKMRLPLISYTSLTVLGKLITDQSIKPSWPRFQPHSSLLRAEKVAKEEEAADRNQITSLGSTVS